MKKFYHQVQCLGIFLKALPKFFGYWIIEEGNVLIEIGRN